MFSVALTSTVARTVDAKLAAEIGGETAVMLLDDLPADFAAPAATTVIRTSDTLTRPGGVRTRVIAIDPATFAAAVGWPSELGSDVDDVVAAVSAPFDDAVPAVAIDGEPAPATGSRPRRRVHRRRGDRRQPARQRRLARRSGARAARRRQPCGRGRRQLPVAHRPVRGDAPRRPPGRLRRTGRAVARALACAPAPLVADEPTAHQDELRSDLVVAGLARTAARGGAVLLATHDDRVLANVTRVVRILDGRVADG